MFRSFGFYSTARRSKELKLLRSLQIPPAKHDFSSFRCEDLQQCVSTSCWQRFVVVVVGVVSSTLFALVGGRVVLISV